MHMSFWWSYNLGDYLFPGFKVQTIAGFVATCWAVASLAFLFEFLRYLQAKQKQKELKLRSDQLKAICPPDATNLLTAHPNRDEQTVKARRVLLASSELSLWFLLQNLGYVIMLSVMLFNGWLFVSALIGGGFGYFVFGQMFMKLNLQNCQIIRETFCMQRCGESDPSLDTTSSDKSVPSMDDGESTPVLVPRTPSASHCDSVEEVVETRAQCH